jgi:hypothetical protein
MTNNDGKQISVFKENKCFEGCIMLGIAAGAWVSFSKLSITVGLGVAILGFGFVSILNRTKRVKSINVQEEVIYVGAFNSLMIELYQCGLLLKEKIGEYYIFRTNYWFLPNGEFVVKIEPQFCLLQSNKILIRHLSEQIAFQRLGDETEIKDNTTY